MKIMVGGQIVIPQELRDQFELSLGTEIDITPTEEGLLIRKSDKQPESPVERMSGILPPGNPIEELGGVDAYISAVRGGGPRGL